MSGRLPEGTVISGFADLVLEAGDRVAIIDHKTFTGNRKEAERKAGEYAGQLEAYKGILREQHEHLRVACYINYPITAGIIVGLK